jgi:prolipoprotein diacylglyceryltransferase
METPVLESMQLLWAAPYHAFYAGGFVAAITIGAVHGLRRGQPPLPWLALLAGCTAAGVVGSRLLFFDLHAPVYGEKTVLGGVAGGILALLLLQRLLPVRGDASARLAPAVLVGFASGRIGCFLAGCCFGTPTALPWGVRYPAGTRPFETHQLAGIADHAGGLSAAVHAVQLYEAVLALCLAWALTRAADRWRSPGANALALGAGFGLLRLIVLPLRHTADAARTGAVLPVQWLLVAGVLAAGCALLVRERRAHQLAGRPRIGPRVARTPDAGTPIAGSAFVVAAVLALLVVGGQWLTPLERLVTTLAVLPAATLLLRRLAERQLPAMAAVTLVAAPLAADTVLPRSWFTVGAGASRGEFETILDLSPGEDCGPADLRTHRYRVQGVSGGFTRRDGKRSGYEVRGRAFGGTNTITHEDGVREDVRISGGSVLGSKTAPLTRSGNTWGSLTGGFVVGNLINEEGVPGTQVELVAGVRAGWGSIFAELQYNDHDPSPNPDTRFKLSLGAEPVFGGTNVRLGVWESGVFVSGRLVTGFGFELEPFIGVITDEQANQYGITVRQRFGSRAPR